MKRVFSAFLCTLLLSTFVFGKFLILSVEERVKLNNLIVIGSLRNISETETLKTRFSTGTLVIEEVIYGNFINSTGQKLISGNKVQVGWQNSKSFACQFGFSENEKEIWFLKVDEEGNINSLSPSTTASLAELAEVNKYLKMQERADNAVKTIKLQSETAFYPSFNETLTQKEFSPFWALLVILTSIALYWVLYRSRFKIR